MKTLFLTFAAAFCLCGADTDFNGKWNIKPQWSRPRVWWLEVENAGTPQIKATFVGAPGGQVDVVRQIRIENGELVWTFSQEGALLKQVYRAKVENGQLVGAMDQSPSNVGLHIPFTGTRAPVITEKDDGTWRPGKKVHLFNGKTTEGWSPTIEDLAEWSVEEGILQNHLGSSDIRSEAKFWNFELHAVFRLKKDTNSGIGLRGRYEIQIYDSFGKEADMHALGAVYSRFAPMVNACKAPGEWQDMLIRLVGRQVTVILNGKKVQDKVEIPGLTAMAIDPDEDTPGPIQLQGDHGVVEFKTLELTELVKR